MGNDISTALDTQQKESKENPLELKKKHRQSIIFNSISILLALGGIAWGISFFLRYYRYEITNDATVEQYITPINSRISGYVKTVNFTDHQWVDAGDTLLVIDDRELKIKQMDAQAALMDAKASSSVLSSSIETTDANVSVSDANIEEAKARLRQSEQELTRNRSLLAAEAISQQDYEQSLSDYDAQRAHYNALLRQRESLILSSDETSKKQGNTEAIILRREADLSLAELNLSYSVIIAPYSGYLGRRTVESGQLLQAGQTLTNLIKNDNKWVIANYREKQIENIYIGQPVHISVDAISDKVFRGKITAISEATGSKYSMLPTDNSAGNFVKIQQRIPVRIEFEDISAEDMQKLRAGMMVVVEAEKK